MKKTIAPLMMALGVILVILALIVKGNPLYKIAVLLRQNTGFPIDGIPPVGVMLLAGMLLMLAGLVILLRAVYGRIR